MRVDFNPYQIELGLAIKDELNRLNASNVKIQLGYKTVYVEADMDTETLTRAVYDYLKNALKDSIINEEA